MRKIIAFMKIIFIALNLLFFLPGTTLCEISKYFEKYHLDISCLQKENGFVASYVVTGKNKLTEMDVDNDIPH